MTIIIIINNSFSAFTFQIKKGDMVQLRPERDTWGAERDVHAAPPSPAPCSWGRLRSGLLSGAVLVKTTRKGGWHQHPFPR